MEYDLEDLRGDFRQWVSVADKHEITAREYDSIYEIGASMDGYLETANAYRAATDVYFRLLGPDGSSGSSITLAHELNGVIDDYARSEHEAEQSFGRIEAALEGTDG